MHNKRRPNNMGGGQHRHHNNRPRRFNNNNRPESGGGGDAASVSRTRRNATQNREKYQMMARDALSMGDRVLAENWLQHADHYHRILLALPPEEAPRPQYLQQPQRYGQGEQQNPGQPGSDGNSTAAENDAQSSGGGQGLPSFITQPTAPENPEER